MQNFSLLDKQQKHGYASVIARQAGTLLFLPLVPYPGTPNVLQLKSMGPPPVIGPAPGKLPPIPRDDPFLQPFNLSAPGITVAQALTLRPSLTPSADPVQGATIANYFIDAMNDSLRTRIPAADIAAIADSDPLVFD